MARPAVPPAAIAPPTAKLPVLIALDPDVGALCAGAAGVSFVLVFVLVVVLVVGLVSSFGNLSTVSFLGETLGSFLI